MERLLWAASSETLDDLECPKCSELSVFVWFTHPAEGEYRTWLVCGNCNFHARAQNTRRPPHYSEDRVSESLENYDERLISNLHFKKP